MGSRTGKARFPVVLSFVTSLMSNYVPISFLYLATCFLYSLEEHDRFALATLLNWLKLAYGLRSYGEGRDERENPPVQHSQGNSENEKNYEVLLCKREPQLRGGEK